MISEDFQQFFQKIARILEHARYELSTPLIGCGGCFDLVAKKKRILLLIKVLNNIDSLREDIAYELQKLALMLEGFPLIVGERVRSSTDIEDGVVYTRYDIPAISVNTLENLLLNNIPPLIFAHRGGFKVKFDGDLLKEKRLEKNFSLGDIARETGISKRAVYEYERGTTDVSLDTAMKIEELLDEPLTMSINLFHEMKKIGSLTQPTSYDNIPKSDIEREVKKHFDSIGLKDQLWTKKIPIRVLAKQLIPKEELEKYQTTITGISEEQSTDDVVKKIQITYSISRIASADPLVVVGSDVQKQDIDGVQVLSVDDLAKLSKKKKQEEEDL